MKLFFFIHIKYLNFVCHKPSQESIIGLFVIRGKMSLILIYQFDEHMRFLPNIQHSLLKLSTDVKK